MFRTSLAVAALLTATPAAAQDPGDMLSADDIPSAATSAAKELAEAGEDMLLIADLIGADVKGPDGDTIGTVEDLVVIPGGKLVAAVLEVDDERIAVPYKAVKVSRSSDKAQAQLDMKPSDLKDSDAVKKLTDALPDD